MITRIVEPIRLHQKARQIRARVPAILSQWGLPAKFSRWRLTQDPDTGMVVLFAVLNTAFIATHSASPSSDYFDPRLLHDLSNDLHLEVISSNSDGMRYAFILDRGSVGGTPASISIRLKDRDGLLASFLQAFDYKGLRGRGASKSSTQGPPRVVIVDEDAFKKRVAENKANRRWRDHIRDLFNQSGQ